MSAYTYYIHSHNRTVRKISWFCLQIIKMIRLVSKKFCNLRPIRRTALAQTIVFESKKDREHWDERNFRLVKWISIISVGTLGSVLGYKIFKKYNFVFPSVKAATVSENSAVNHRAKFNFIADVVSTSKNSVVYIEIKDKRRSDFFMGQPAVVSNGSGFVVDSNGLILTNAHVVLNKPNTVVQVKLFDGRVFDGVIDSVDAQSDLATIRIACNNLPAIKLGKSSDIKAGEWVVAMGSPLALSNTVTAGVVSSTQRPSEELGLRGRNINYIQTDAAITFGNSGGPLVNLDGEAIGINSMKLTAGISFAIPIDYAKEFLAKAAERRQFGKPERDKVAVRRYLGITMLSLTPDILHELKQRSHEVPNHIRHGILVWKVIIGSPAHSSGLMPGDIIVDIDGVAVKNSQDIYDILASSDKNINMTIYRGPTLLRIVVRPEEL